jgi:ribosomal protein S18 acetylase RimI-like enzyme
MIKLTELLGTKKCKYKISEHKLDTVVRTFEDALMAKYPQLDSVGMYMQSSNGALYLSDLYIKPGFKGQGIGSKVMQEIVAFADKHGLSMVLIPEPDTGSVQRLVKFYSRFGFKLNQGKNIDFTLRLPLSTSMYRLPKK